LLERSSKRVDLTDAGRALLPKALAALDAARDARDAVHEVSGGLRGSLRIGTMVSVGLIDLAVVLGQFHRRYPAVALHLTTSDTGGSRGHVQAVLDHRLDLAFVSVPGPAPAGVHLTYLTSAPLDLVVPVGHPLAARADITIADLADLVFIDSPLGYGNRSVVDLAFADAGVQRQVSIEIADIAVGTDYVRHGLGIALLPRFAIQPHPDLVRLTVTDTELRWPLSLATSAVRKTSAATQALQSLLQDYVVGAVLR
jgi:DNA-binding transcriptional LysR family regulator